MAKIWQCGLRVLNPDSHVESTLYGYGGTPEKAVNDAKSIALFRKEALVSGVKPVLREAEEETFKRPVKYERE